jgi:hypothetical protein
MEVYNLTQDITEKQHHLFYKKRERDDHLQSPRMFNWRISLFPRKDLHE